MIIRKIGIDGFGKFHRNAFEFQPGINLIYGENEAGKTTLEQFLIGMLYDVEKLRGKGAKHDVYNRYYPEYGGKYGGIMEFEFEQNCYRVQRTFRREQKDIALYDLMTGREIPIEKELCDTCGFMTKEQFMETLCMNPGQIRTGNYLREELNRYSHRISSSGTTQFDVEEAIRQLLIRKRRNQKKQAKEQMLQLKSGFLSEKELNEKKQQLLSDEKQLELELESYKEKLIQKQQEIQREKQRLKEQKAKEILEDYEEKRAQELKLAKEKLQLKSWLEEDVKEEHELKELPQKTEEKKKELEEWLDGEEEMAEELGLPITALICFLAGFAGIWKQWLIAGIGMILVGCVLLVLSFFQKNQDKNLSDTRSMVQLEDGVEEKDKEEVFRDNNPYKMLKPEFLAMEEHIKKELEALDYESEENLLLRKEEAIIQAKIADCEKELLENQVRQRTLLEEEQRNKQMRSQYEDLKQEVQQIEYDNKATDLAVTTLRELSANIYHEFGHSFNQEVSKIMEAITDGRYQRVIIDEQMGIQVEQDGKFVGMEQMSLGTTEQIYFAIRMAASHLFPKGEILPILIDDVFGSFDGERLGKTLKYLSECSNRQVFVFTCNRRIRDILLNQRTDFSYLEL